MLNKKDHRGKFEPKVDEAIFLGYSMHRVAYRVLNRRTRVIKESFDVTFDDYHIRHEQNKNGVTFILESDIPEGHGPINMGVIDYDSLFGLWETALDAEKFLSQPIVAPQLIAPQEAAPQPNGADILVHAPIPPQLGQQSRPITVGAGPPPSTIEGERSIPTVEGEQHVSTSQGEHVNSSEETMGDDNFNILNGPFGASAASDNQQLVDVSRIIQNDVVEVVSTAAEEHQLQRLHI